MNGIHDMGGMHGMGPINPEQNEPVFHAPWEGRTYAMNTAARAFMGNGSARRYAIELIPPAEYLRMGYFEKWFVRLVNMLVDGGKISRQEVSTGKPARGSTKLTPPLRKEDVSAYFSRATRTVIQGPPPRFVEGQAVRTRNINPTGHTRLPRYARGRLGTIKRDNGVFSFPDTLALQQPDKPQHCYSVRFSARELWGEQARPQDAIYIDLFDDYLEPA